MPTAKRLSSLIVAPSLASCAARFLPLAIALALASCAAPPTRRHDAPLIAEAAERSRSGDYAGASQIYQRLAEQADSIDTSYYRLLAADAELREGNDRAAQALLGAIDADALEEGDRQRYALLKARVDVNQGRAREAMARLDSLDEQRLTTPLRANYHILRASAYNQLGNMLECARERVYYGQLINSPEAIQKNNEGIYDALNRLPYAVLTGMQPSTRGTLGGWMALVIVLRGPEAGWAQGLQDWKSKYPGHPANGSFLQNFMSQMSQQPKAVMVTPLKPAEPPPAQAVQTPAPAPAQTPPAAAPAGGFVGVLLPLTGQYGAAGLVVRAGLTAAASADTGAAKPELRFVDTQGGDIPALYQKLVGEGAKFVIGPLTKEEVSALGKVDALPVPVLALNQVAELNREGLYQFALTPEQEVEQAASLAWFDGRQNALLLSPASAFGQRLASHFTAYWQSLGGKIATARTYQPGAPDYSATAKQLVSKVAEGEEAAPDATPQFIFLIADSRDGRLLNPHIQNQPGGENLPIYATSLIFNGQPGAVQNQDLTGVTFCDSPWLLGDDSGPLSRQALQAQAQQTPEPYLRLLPMGIDAYQLLAELDQFKSGAASRYNGATGVLALKAGNRIQRQLHCAQFEGSALQPRGPAPSLQPGAQ